MKILCLGQSAYDITIPTDGYPEEKKKYKVNEVYECGGGSCNNSAYLLAKWHDEVYIASPIGMDDYGKKIKKELEGIPTTTSYIINNKVNGSRTIVTNRNPKLHFSYNYNIDLKPDIILYDGNEFDMGIQIAKNNPDAIKIIDAGNMKDGMVELAKCCDYVVCSNDFAKEYTGINFTYQDMNKICEAYDKMQNDFKGKVIITLEAMGSLVKIDNEFKLVKSIEVESVDSTGAGDIYHGAFTHFIKEGFSLLDTMKYANIAGALSVTKIGSKNSMPTLEDVVNYHEL